ncbi:DnaJ C terminal domain-containing protein [Syncephalis pseudoplumigaleata]|uniref:DnaJ C terminal domain-containing protein n=1 Tax=Syncephalis pseudoplumigaleata TaxID=1712513 RepID=A0A4P9Z2L4_9FUNG|nr:DnaJ C terminal domain-containing protein [Syncephalis pseudoplumigaleata]|eukprot:RKP25710.1 DnaJ C terminal domain-containing protein [Syncephalis pseudoplumigaleata]
MAPSFIPLLSLCMVRFFGGGGGGGRDGGYRQRSERKGPKMMVGVSVTLEELYVGTEIEVDIARQEVCHHCRGSGARSSEHIHTCDACGGHGVRVVRQMLAPGMYTEMQTTCDVCGGKGTTIKEHCPVCGGRKVVRGSEQLTVVIEPGMQPDETFEGEGDASADYAAGDVHFVVRQQPHAIFTRNGAHLHMQRNITLLEALIGFKHEIKHLDGHAVVLEREQVTPSGYTQVIPGQGMPVASSDGYGDLHVQYSVIYPESIEEHQKTALKEILA